MLHQSVFTLAKTSGNQNMCEVDITAYIYIYIIMLSAVYFKLVWYLINLSNIVSHFIVFIAVHHQMLQPLPSPLVLSWVELSLGGLQPVFCLGFFCRARRPALFVTPCPFEKAEMTPCPFD